ncbi:MAG TPA: hypothetical protein VMV59_00565 [Candidatus Dormibacteraeota bacterium]|nr:hypothetical protein [Candidatus Dormibacteraeota bacterium]
MPVKQKALVIAVVLVAVAIVSACVFVLAQRRRTRGLDAALQSSDIRVMFEGSLGEALFASRPAGRAIVVPGDGMKALLSPSKSPQGPGLIDDYERNPEKFRRYAKLYETAQNAFRLGQSVQEQGRAFHLPITSFSLNVPADQKVDAWGHPYCISRTDGGIAVVSGGPGAPSFSCAQQRTHSSEISKSSRAVFQTRLGEVVVVTKQSFSQASAVAR